MNNLTLQNSMQFTDDITKEYNKILRQLFNGKINGSFLIKIKNMVIDELGGTILQYMPLPATAASLVTGNITTHEYDICRMIVGTHRHHTMFLTKEKTKELQNSRDYQKKLANEVIEKIHLHNMSNVFFSKKQLFPGDEFIYFPVPYELFALCIRFHHIHHERNVKTLIYNVDIINNALSALTLMEQNLLSNAYPLCRSMIEQCFKTMMLEKHPECIDTFSEFCGFEIEQACCSQEFPDEFNVVFEKRKQVNLKNKVDYLHYGWLDEIATYTTTQSNRYSLYGIIDYLCEISDDEVRQTLSQLKVLYKECHGYIHGSSNHVIYPLLHYFELSIMLYHIVKGVFLNLHKTALLEMSDFDKNLLAQLDRDFEVLLRQYRMRSTEMFELYYEK